MANNKEIDPLTSGYKRLTNIGNEELVILSTVCIDGWSLISTGPQPS